MTLAKIKFTSLLILTIACQYAYALYPETDYDYAMLPELCKARASGGGSPAYQKWVRLVGENFIHVHHYCAGLHSINVAFRTKGTQKKELFEVAINEMKYVIDKSSPTFKLLPRIYYDQGKAYEYSNITNKAIKAYEKSINLYSKTALPFAALSDIYIKNNQPKEAKEILEKGLVENKNSKMLLKRIAKIK